MAKETTISPGQTSLRDKLVGLMDKKGLKPADIARITGRSEGTISELLNNKKAFSDKLVAMVMDTVKDYVGDMELVATRQYTKMWNIAKTGKEAGDMRLVVGNSGIGKSVVFKKFAEETKCCCYYKICSPTTTWNKFLHEVCRGFGVKMAKKKDRYYTAELMAALVSHVEEHSGSSPMLIVDESEVMRNSFFKEFKNLQTATEGLLSIVIVGITEVKARIAKLAGLDGDTWMPCRTDSNQYTTFARRIKHFRIENISTEDIRLFCNENGITNEKVIAEAVKKWWNYAEADRAIKRAKRMGINVGELTVDEFNIL